MFPGVLARPGRSAEHGDLGRGALEDLADVDGELAVFHLPHGAAAPDHADRARRRAARKWSGDHCSTDTAVTHGSLIINRPLDREPHIMDIAPTVLAAFGVEPRDDYDGRSLI